MQINPSTTLNWETVLTLGMLIGTGLTIFFIRIFPAIKNGKSKYSGDDKIDEVIILLVRIEERLESLSKAIANTHVLLERHYIESHDIIEKLKEDREPREK